MALRYRGRASINPFAPRAVGTCDRCGIVYNLDQLAPQFIYAGNAIISKNIRVCARCMDPLNPQDRPIITGLDPEPIDDPRPLDRTLLNAGRYNWTIRPQPAWLQWASGPPPTTSNVMSPVVTGVGALTWSGHAPTVSILFVVSPGVAALSWSGYTPTTTYRVTAGVGAATWTGHAPTVRYAVFPGVGAATWSGHAPSYSREQDAQVGFAPFGELAYGQGGRAV